MCSSLLSIWVRPQLEALLFVSTDGIKKIRHLGFVFLKNDIVDFLLSIPLYAGSPGTRSQLLSGGISRGRERRQKTLSPERMLGNRVSGTLDDTLSKIICFLTVFSQNLNLICSEIEQVYIGFVLPMVHLVSPTSVIPYVTSDSIAEGTQR